MIGRASIFGWIAAAVMFVASLAEVAAVPVSQEWRLLLPVLGTALCAGFLPGFLLSFLGDRIRDGGSLRRFGALWLPWVTGVTCAAGVAALGGVAGWPESTIAIFASLGAAAAIHRIVPSVRQGVDGVIAPAAVVLTLASAFCVADASDAMTAVSSLQLGVPPIVGAGGVLLQLVHRGLTEVGKKVQAGLVAAGSVAGLAVIVWLARWLPELNASLKFLVALGVALGVATLAEPLVGRSRAVQRPWAAIVGVVLTASYLVWTVMAPIAERFAGLDRRSVAATAPEWISKLSDGDRDGFYREDVGGNDCDDDEPSVHPFAPVQRRSCLPAGTAATVAEPSSPRRDVLVVIVDALRADELDTPKKRERFPALARLADESVRFSVAYSPGNSTFTSLPSMLSGLGPQLVLGAIVDQDPGPYAELMRGQWMFDRVPEDRCTAFIVSAHEETSWLFDLYPRDVDFRRTETAVDDHGHGSPIVPPAVGEALEKCGNRPTLFALYLDEPHLEGVAGHSCFGGTKGGRECYVDEIKAVDEALGKVFELYESKGRWQDLAVLFTSDHGEAFGDRGHVGHTSNVFEEQVRVPMWLRDRSLSTGEVATPVSGLSVSLTAVSLTGSAGRPSPYPTLLAVAREPGALFTPPVTASATGRAKYGWTSPRTAIRKGNHKLVYDWATTHVELYDLMGDPRETRNLASEEPEVVEPMLRELLQIERSLLVSRVEGREPARVREMPPE